MLTLYDLLSSGTRHKALCRSTELLAMCQSKADTISLATERAFPFTVLNDCNAVLDVLEAHVRQQDLPRGYQRPQINMQTICASLAQCC